MDAIDILGALLGKKSPLTQPKPANSPHPGAASRTSSPAPRQRPATIEDAATSLEDLLGVGSGAPARSPHANQPHSHQPAPNAAPTQQPNVLPTSPSRSSAAPPEPAPRGPVVRAAMNEQAKLLIGVMVAAAKADGRVTEEEQQAILGQIEQPSPADLAFLRAEFAKPLDVKAVAWSVPLGLEEQAYAVSVMAMQIDEQSEANYLSDLAHGLRLAPAKCNEIHRKLGAPEIFR